jgi:hypothetical protein
MQRDEIYIKIFTKKSMSDQNEEKVADEQMLGAAYKAIFFAVMCDQKKTIYNEEKQVR